MPLFFRVGLFFRAAARGTPDLRQLIVIVISVGGLRFLFALGLVGRGLCQGLIPCPSGLGALALSSWSFFGVLVLQPYSVIEGFLKLVALPLVFVVSVGGLRFLFALGLVGRGLCPGLIPCPAGLGALALSSWSVFGGLVPEGLQLLDAYI